MSDEIAENGTANGDVPEIELIIKVSYLFCTCYDAMRRARSPGRRSRLRLRKRSPDRLREHLKSWQT